MIDLATDDGVEELLVAGVPEGSVEYAFEAPSGWTRRKASGFERLVEFFDERGTARLRFRARRAWDADGREVALSLGLEGNRIRVSWQGAGALPVVIDPEWTSTGKMAEERSGHSTTLLTTGEVLIAGGHSNAKKYVATAELYDPGSGTFRASSMPMSVPRYMHTATVLPSGKVVLVSGRSAPGPAELYDPRTDTFSTTAGSTAARTFHTATLLADGRVLVVGGMDAHGAIADAELYDPAADTFQLTAPMARGRKSATATLLESGKVLVAGGCDAASVMSCAEVLATTELFDPLTNQFGPGATMASPRRLHSATRLADGRVFVAGGDADDGGYDVRATELFDPSANGGVGAFAPGPDMSTARAYHSSVLLPSGKLLLAGGCTGAYCGDDQTSTELLDPSQSVLTLLPGPPLVARRSLPGAVVLPSGKVLIAGGMTGSDDLLTTELLEPLADDEEWVSLPAETATARAGHTATLLSSGEVLLTAGCSAGVGFCDTALSSAERFEPQAMWSRASASAPWQPAQGSDTFVPQGDSAIRRESHTATLLADGRVVIIGGFDPGHGGVALGDVRVFDRDAGAGTFSASAGLVEPRGYHTATLLPSGKVLVAGGCADWLCSTVLGEVELWDPATGASRGMTPLQVARGQHTATLLADGRVLIAGGCPAGQEGNSLAQVELYTPSANDGEGESHQAPTLLKPRKQHTGTLLPSGAVLLAGGYQGSEPIKWAEVFEPWADAGQGALRVTGVMMSPRVAHTATLLPWGEVLLAGGLDAFPDQPGVTLASTEIYDPAGDHGDGTFRPSAPMAHARAGHTSTLLPSGDVLVVGGRRVAVDDYDRTVELWRRKGRAPEASRPRLTPPSVAIPAGQTSTLAGSGLLGVSDASGGGTWMSASNTPALSWIPAEGSGSLKGSPFDFSATKLAWQPPVTALLGNGFVRVVSAGAWSVAAPLALTAASQATVCPTGSGCDSGHCVDGVCCDSPCDGLCEACAAPIRGGGADGTCAPIVAGMDPEDECPKEEGVLCGLTGACNGQNGCEHPADGEPCGDGGVCQSMACVLETSPECVDGHVLKLPDGSEVDCLPLRCTQAGACLGACSTTADCVDGYRCNATGQCEEARPSAPAAAPVGCDCGATGHRGSDVPWWWWLAPAAVVCARAAGKRGRHRQ